MYIYICIYIYIIYIEIFIKKELQRPLDSIHYSLYKYINIE